MDLIVAEFFGCSSGCRKHAGVAAETALLITQSLLAVETGDISLVNVGEIYWCNVAANQFTNEM